MAPTVVWFSGNTPSETSPYAITTVNGCSAAAQHADFQNYGYMEIRNGMHTSRSDSKKHCTVRVKAVATSKVYQVAHIYLDLVTSVYLRHELFPTIHHE
ncbi:hypothetical protein BDZ91DRAFT_844936 [Kalaharituber pfeilii]|nr:hypothetical protein BDZ91DRAFT_844936 [Kalaharituber pfeilii]